MVANNALKSIIFDTLISNIKTVLCSTLLYDIKAVRGDIIWEGELE